MYNFGHICKMTQNFSTDELCSGKYGIQVIIVRRMSWTGHVTHMVGTKYAFKILVGEPEVKKLHGSFDMDERLIVSVILKLYIVRAWTGFSCPRMRTSGGLLRVQK